MFLVDSNIHGNKPCKLLLCHFHFFTIIEEKSEIHGTNMVQNLWKQKHFSKFEVAKQKETTFQGCLAYFQGFQGPDTLSSIDCQGPMKGLMDHLLISWENKKGLFGADLMKKHYLRFK